MEQKPEAIIFDVQPETQEFRRFSQTRLRYQLLVEVDNDECLIFDEPTNYIEVISNINSEKMVWSHEIWNGFHVHQPSMDFGWST